EPLSHSNNHINNDNNGNNNKQILLDDNPKLETLPMNNTSIKTHRSKRETNINNNKSSPTNTTVLKTSRRKK
ncbi:unnamed protein product, partial [Schistosoma turkestanicum]